MNQRFAALFFVSLAALIVPQPCCVASEQVVYVVPIDGAIEMGLRHVVARALREADENEASLIVLEIDTLGGGVEAAVQIAEMMMETSHSTVAFINKRAVSAGALLALSCKKIITHPGGKMGAATPVMMTPGSQPQPTGEKYVSYVRAEFRSAAERNGHPRDIAEAMVDPDVEIPNVIQEGKLLTLAAEQSLRVNMAEAMVESQDDLLNYLGITDFEIITLREYWTEKVARFLAHPAVTSLLMMAGLMSLWIAWKTPGLGVPELAAVVCFSVFFWGHSIAGLAGWGTLVLFFIGVGLLVVELFVIPGFGFVGVAGIGCVVLSVVFALLEHPITSPLFDISSLYPPLYILGIAFVGSVLFSILLAGLLPKTSLYHHIVLEDSEKRVDGYHSSEERSLAIPVGTEGIALTALRPAGVAVFDKQRYDVVSTGEFIADNTPVEVVEIEGRRLVVRRKEKT